MAMTQEEFSARFKGSPIERAKRRGLLRNVAVALGNWGAPRGCPRAVDGAARRGAARPRARGVGAGAHRPGGGGAALRGRKAVEADAWVREEIGEALEPTARD
jgi:epoxyqueuosine reductase